MGILFYSVCWLVVFLLVLSAILFSLKHANRLSVPRGISLGDLANLVAVLFAVFSLAFAIASYEDAAQSSRQQQETLKASNDALKQAVDIAKAQEEQLKQTTERSKEQVELLRQAGNALKSQLELSIKQIRQEEARAARRPKIKIVFVTGYGQADEIEIPARTLTFGVSFYNTGTANLISPEISLSAVCQDPNGLYTSSAIARWNPLGPESLGPILIHEEHPFVTSSIRGGGYTYDFRIRCHDESSWLDIRVDVEGENMTSVSKELIVNFVSKQH